MKLKFGKKAEKTGQASSTNIYLDIDGVILANDKQAANHAHKFIEHLVSNYTVYWLTTHCHGDASTAVERLSLVLEPKTIELCKKILPTDWDEAKTEGIDFSKTFLWFDDDLYPQEKQALEQAGALQAWVQVDLSRDADQLAKLVQALQEVHPVLPA